MTTPTTFAELVDFIVDIISLIVPAIFTFIFLYFIWKIIDSWILNAGDEAKLQEGKNYTVAAVVVFVLMVSLWGIVAMLRGSFFS